MHLTTEGVKTGKTNAAAPSSKNLGETIGRAIPPIPDGTCISNIATNMVNVILSTATRLVPRSERPCGAQGWCAGSGAEAEMNTAWQQRKEARRPLCAESHSSNLRKAVKMARKIFGRCARLPC